jgi:uncharacterized Zn finger protein
VTSPNFREYGPTIRVEGGLKAQSTRGNIGESWWSRRFIAVLESFGVGSRLARGKSYARQGQVLSLDISPGTVSSRVQGSRPDPYAVRIDLAVVPAPKWSAIEKALAAQALFAARLLAGEMPAEIEEVFAQAKAPLFPTRPEQLEMQCSCPDWSVPCKHLAATIYLLAEAFDADPFQILHWRGRTREQLLEHLRAGAPRPRKARGQRIAAAPAVIGARMAVAELASPDLAETVERFWVAPVPLPARPPTLDIDVDLLLRQLPTPAAALGGAELVSRLRPLYQALRPSRESA